MYHEDTVVMIKTTKYTPGFLHRVNKLNKLKKKFFSTINQDYKEILKFKNNLKNKVGKPQ